MSAAEASVATACRAHIALVLDLSPSMAMPFAPRVSRLDAARSGVVDTVDALHGAHGANRWTLVGFHRQAEVLRQRARARDLAAPLAALIPGREARVDLGLRAAARAFGRQDEGALRGLVLITAGEFTSETVARSNAAHRDLLRHGVAVQVIDFGAPSVAGGRLLATLAGAPARRAHVHTGDALREALRTGAEQLGCR